MKRAIALVATALGLAACSGQSGRAFATYYDPEGLFSTSLPVANTITVTPPQSSGTGPGLLTGVVAAPPQPSPSPSSGLGGGGLLSSSQAQTDQTIYEAFAISTGEFEDLDAMALYFLTGDPGVDMLQQDPIRVASSAGRLLVADVSSNGATSASVAAAFTLGSGGTGFLVAAIFPPGEWSAERADFLHVLESFTSDVPPALTTYPLVEPAA